MESAVVIYMVECGFADASREVAWNEWYSGHLRDFLTVSEFRTTQRFIAIGPSSPRYRAMYTLESPAAFENPVYKGFKGGNFPIEWRSAITDFHRNLFDAGMAAPMVDDQSALVIVDDPETDEVAGIRLAIWRAVGLDKSVAIRGLAVIGKANGEALAEKRLPRVGVYAALTGQLSKGAGV
jgi:hypothetical protein